MYDIYDRTWTSRLQIFQKDSRVPSVCVGRVDTFRREVVQFLKVRVPGIDQFRNSRSRRVPANSHDNLLLIGVLERFGALDGVFALRAY